MQHRKAGTLTIASKRAAIILGWSLTTACAIAPNPDNQRPLPDYAIQTGGYGGWVVTCVRGSVYGDWNTAKSFYDENGTLKDRERFCDDIQTGSRITR